MNIMIRKCRLEISDKIVDGLGKCFILVSHFILPYSKISLFTILQIWSAHDGYYLF